jgi:hypothetical protein
MARQWTSVLRCLIRSAGVGAIVASFGVTTGASLVGGSAIQQTPRLIDIVAGLSFGGALSSDGSVLSGTTTGALRCTCFVPDTGTSSGSAGFWRL